MVTWGTPHEPKSISSNCPQPRRTGAFCGFPNWNTQFSLRDSFGRQCFQDQTCRRQYLGFKIFDLVNLVLGLGRKFILMHAMMIFVIFYAFFYNYCNWSDTGSSCISQDGSARFLWVLPGWHCSLGPQMSLWWVRLQEDFTCGKVVVYVHWRFVMYIISLLVICLWFVNVYSLIHSQLRNIRVRCLCTLVICDLASFLRNQIQVAVANIIEDRPSQ